MTLDYKTSEWLREALRTALLRDPVEAANDAEILRTLLLRRAAESGDHHDTPAPDRSALPGGSRSPNPAAG